jgi:hypothetical protein
VYKINNDNYFYRWLIDTIQLGEAEGTRRDQIGVIILKINICSKTQYQLAQVLIRALIRFFNDEPAAPNLAPYQLSDLIISECYPTEISLHLRFLALQISVGTRTVRTRYWTC